MPLTCHNRSNLNKNRFAQKDILGLKIYFYDQISNSIIPGVKDRNNLQNPFVRLKKTKLPENGRKIEYCDNFIMSNKTKY